MSFAFQSLFLRPDLLQPSSLSLHTFRAAWYFLSFISFSFLFSFNDSIVPFDTSIMSFFSFTSRISLFISEVFSKSSCCKLNISWSFSASSSSFLISCNSCTVFPFHLGLYFCIQLNLVFNSIPLETLLLSSIPFSNQFHLNIHFGVQFITIFSSIPFEPLLLS